MSSKVPLSLFEPSAAIASEALGCPKKAVTNTHGKDNEANQISDMSSLLDTKATKRGMKISKSKAVTGGIKPLKSDFIVTPSVHKTTFNSIKGHTVAFTSAGLAGEKRISFNQARKDLS